ncbi:hypothetical protein DL98DRAFT_653857 [Cadophora sp. DSE1049]|nr:hypothetical protein DL98DRAFT_653857 [Cadophora sp. DSE1049]
MDQEPLRHSMSDSMVGIRNDSDISWSLEKQFPDQTTSEPNYDSAITSGLITTAPNDTFFPGQICRYPYLDSWPSFNDTFGSPQAAFWQEQQLAQTIAHELEEHKPLHVNRVCQWSGCSEKQPFQQESTFRRHMDKHERPYKCIVSSCKAPDFTNPGDLKRHQRAVHGKGTFFCPVSSCKRHARGFGRKDNKEEHVKRVHSLESSITSQSPERQDSDQRGHETQVEIGSPMSERGGSEMDGLTSRTPSQDPSKLLLVAKLAEFRDAKAAAIAELSATFDKDIEALERVLSFT